MQQTIQKSTFVTAVAWVFIALSGFGTLIAIAQNVMVYAIFSRPEVVSALQAPAPPGTPPFAVFMMKHMWVFFAAFLLVSTTTLASSVGLLMRRNWARRLFIGLMALGVAWNLGGLVLQFSMFASMKEQFAAVPEAPDMEVFFVVITVVSVVFALAFSGLFGWIAKRLLSAPVAAEFVR